MSPTRPQRRPGLLFIAFIAALCSCEKCPPPEPVPGFEGELHFSGATFGDELLPAGGSIYATAVGGTQTIHIWSDDTGEVPYAEAWDPPPADPDAAFEVQSYSASSAVILGIEPGNDLFEVTEPGAFDTTRIDAIRLDIDELVVNQIRLTVPFDLPFRIQDPQASEDGLAIAYSNVKPVTRLTLALFAADGTRLVDESLSVSASSGFVRDGHWDSVRVAGADSDGAVLDVGTHVIDGIVAGQVFSVLLPVVDGADAIVVLDDPGDYGPPKHTLALDESSFYCFRATVGSGTSTDPLRVIVGPPLEIESSNDDIVSVSADLSCASAVGRACGSADLVARWGAIESEPFAVTVACP